MKENQLKIFPLNLQFFAEPEPTPTPDPNVEPTVPTEPEPQPNLEARIQQLLIDNAKLKKATDSATSEASSFKKQLREKLSADELASQVKAEKEAEREEKYNSLLKENAVTRLEKGFLKLGYPEDKAKEAADAQYNNDTDLLFNLQSEQLASALKQKESEWIKNRPAPQGGNGDGEKQDPFLTAFNRR